MGRKKIVIEHYNEVIQKYSKLNAPLQINGGWQIDGVIDVIDDEGGYWDSYDISIIIPSSYPDDLPFLIESGKKIERHEDWHMSPNGVCCLSTKAKMFYDLGGDITLLRWLDQFAHPFLANHVYRMKTKHYAHDEFSHGVPGIIEGWKKILNVHSTSEILQQLEYMAGNKTLPRNRKCYCKSGKLYKRCYLLQRSNHRLNISVDAIREDIRSIRKGYF